MKNPHEKAKNLYKRWQIHAFEDSGKPEIIAPKLWQNINEFLKIQVSKEN